MTKKLTELMNEYGPVALIVYLALFAMVLGTFMVLLGSGLESFIARLGFEPDGLVASAGVLGGAYLLTRLTWPARVAATLVLTPILGRVVRRRPKDNLSPPAR